MLKDIGALEELTNLVKQKKPWFVNFILTQSKFGYLWKRKPPEPRNNQETSCEFESESESSDSQYFGDASNSAVDFPEDIDKTSKLLGQNGSFRCKIEHFELKSKKVKEDNIKLKSHICNFGNVSESGDKFRAAAGLTVESFNNLLDFLNPGKRSCNIKFYDTSGRLSQIL